MRARWAKPLAGRARRRRIASRGAGDAARGHAVCDAALRELPRPGRTGAPHGGSVIDPAYLALVSDQALRTAVVAGRPDLGMPDWRGGAPGRRRSARTGGRRRGGVDGVAPGRRRDEREHGTPRRRGVAARRSAIALNAVAATLLAVPLVGFVLSPARRWSWQQWIALGPLTDFPESQTRLATYRNPFSRPWDGETANIPCWVRSISGDEFQVFAINCAHLGCPVRWFPASGLFMCPCHGGVYYADGQRASGPPPRALYRVRVQDRERPALGARRTDAHAVGVGADGRRSATDRRLARSSASDSASRSRRSATAPRPARHRELVVRLRQRHAGRASSCRS